LQSVDRPSPTMSRSGLGPVSRAITGSSRGLTLPFQLRPTVIPAPPEGVVRRGFASTVANGPSTVRIPRKPKTVWAHFRFATQPSSRLPISVAWYRPNGKLIGSVAKSNRPEIVSSLGTSAGIPNGIWVAVLRAGSKVVTRLAVRIG
jgi:hypothetical protein